MKERGKISSLKTIGAFLNGRACSDTLLYVLNRAFGDVMEREEAAIMPMAGGVMQHGHYCGMIWGAALAAGARAFELWGDSGSAEARAIAASARLVETFRAKNRYADCVDITHTDRSSSTFDMVRFFLLQGGSIGCFRMSAAYAPLAWEAIKECMTGEIADVPEAPHSCASLCARAMGATEKQAVMASGLAGGIGLTGGACGALATAIWIQGVKALERGEKKPDFFNNPGALKLIEAVKERRDSLVCSEIVGRTFEGPEDHSRFLKEGGCSDLIQSLVRISGE